MRTEAYLISQKGFTLLECILALSIASVVLFQVGVIIDISSRYSIQLKKTVNGLHLVSIAAHTLIKAMHNPFEIVTQPEKNSKLLRLGSGKYQGGQVLKSSLGEFYMGKNRFKQNGLFRFSHGFRREVAAIDSFKINTAKHRLIVQGGGYVYTIRL